MSPRTVRSDFARAGIKRNRTRAYGLCEQKTNEWKKNAPKTALAAFFHIAYSVRKRRLLNRTRATTSRDIRHRGWTMTRPDGPVLVNNADTISHRRLTYKNVRFSMRLRFWSGVRRELLAAWRSFWDRENTPVPNTRSGRFRDEVSLVLGVRETAGSGEKIE